MNDMLYHIDVPTYHWDNDRFEREVKTLTTDSIEDARNMRTFLLDLEFTDDDLCRYHDLPGMYRYKKTFPIPYTPDRALAFDKIDVHLGVIVESEFYIYTEKTTRTVIE